MQHPAFYSMPATLVMQYNGVPIPMASPKNLQNASPATSNIEDNSEVAAVPQTTLTPCTSPEENNVQPFSKSIAAHNALKQLQVSWETNSFLPPPLSISPISSENSDMDTENFQKQLINGVPINVPTVNSRGKTKQFKCKYCKFVAITKTELWEHSGIHIQEDKQLRCSKCKFVTESKQHFVYHMRSHIGCKPFKCSQCSYSSINKAMLNSHLKTHSTVYPYSCADCEYVTKHLTCLKKHLRKHTHKPGVARNPDGTPNPLLVIDVYGTRRGPKIKLEKLEPSGSFPFNPLPFNVQQMQFPSIPSISAFPAFMPNPFHLAILETLINKRQELLNENTPRVNQEEPSENQGFSLTEEGSENQFQQIQCETEVLDLSKPHRLPVQKSLPFKHTPGQNDDDSNEKQFTTIFDCVEVVENIPAETYIREESTSEKLDPHNHNKGESCCKFCKINFGDPVLYSMHMGYHSLENPFTCNMCGEECTDKFEFFAHIARSAHFDKTH